MEQTDRLVFARKECVYTKCYCEENVWHLCKNVKETHTANVDGCHVVFISNDSKCVCLWQQQSAKTPENPVLWDYHVILIHQPQNDESLVYDLDTALSFPCSFIHYAERAFGSEKHIIDEYHRMFRVIPAEVFLSNFASDRSHMLKEDESWMSPPPSYPCIKTEGYENNLAEFMSMDPSIGFGTVLNLEELCDKFGKEDLFASLVSLPS